MREPDVIFVRMLPSPVPRVMRMVQYAKSRSARVAYVGAHRGKGAADRELVDGVDVVRIGPYVPRLNGRSPGRYVSGLVGFNMAALRLFVAQKPRVIHCSDLETTPAALLYGLLLRIPVIYNIHDNYAERYPIGRTLRGVLNAIEGLAVLLSRVSVVPEAFRRDSLPVWCRRKILIVRNAPKAVEASRPVSGFGRRPTRVTYAGWLDDGRGIRELIQLADENQETIEVHVAGEGSAELEAALSISSVRFHGPLSHAQTLDLFRESDFVAAIYGPARPINRMAAPNKVAEALALGRPIIANTEVLMTCAPEFAGCSVRLPYRDLSLLPALLSEIASEGNEAFELMCHNARSAFEQLYSTEEQERAIAAVYHRAGLSWD